MTPCGHFGCFRCLLVSMASNCQCPVCTKTLPSPSLCRSALMNRLLKDRVSRMSARDQQCYFRRFFRDAEWNQRRKVKAPAMGSLVDLQVRGVWMQGRIKKFFRRANNRSFVAISLSSEVENELILPLKSLRVAPQGFFTAPKYRDYDPTGTVPVATKGTKVLSEQNSNQAITRRQRSCSFTLLNGLAI